MEKITFLRLYSNLINIVNIKILSLNFFSKTTHCPFNIPHSKIRVKVTDHHYSLANNKVVTQVDIANGLNRLHTDTCVCESVCVCVCVRQVFCL